MSGIKSRPWITLGNENNTAACLAPNSLSDGNTDFTDRSASFMGCPFTLNTCAYTTELLAGAIQATPRGEVEAARSLGLAGISLYARIILPSALRRALPAYSNEVILMLHATSLASAATVPDILKVARDANADYYQPFVAFGIAALLYASLCITLIWLFRKAERKWLMHLSRA